MTWVDIIVALILFFSFVGGVKDGAVKQVFSLLAILIALPLASLTYHWLRDLLAFLPGGDWENFLGFLITSGVISAILNLIFFLPRKAIQVVWNKGFLFRLIGGILILINVSVGLVVFVLVLRAFPVWDWLAENIARSDLLTWLVDHLVFVRALLPGVFSSGAATSIKTMFDLTSGV
ncbi:MAG: CvpA family protein [Chloroflexi bacterium]|nr:CvpA family protein [Chloroflexota bacterium]